MAYERTVRGTSEIIRDYDLVGLLIRDVREVRCWSASGHEAWAGRHPVALALVDKLEARSELGLAGRERVRGVVYYWQIPRISGVVRDRDHDPWLLVGGAPGPVPVPRVVGDAIADALRGLAT